MAQLLAALIPGAVIDVFIGVGIFFFARAARAYEADKSEGLRALGLYWPESVDSNEPLPPAVRKPARQLIH